MESNDSNYLYLGVVSRAFGSNSSAMNSAGVWTLQADGYVYDNGSGAGYGASYRNGDRVSYTFFIYFLDVNRLFDDISRRWRSVWIWMLAPLSFSRTARASANV